MALNRPPQPAECAFFTREYRSVPSPSVRRAIDQRFPKGDRYSNIDLLVGAKRQSDPIEAWHIQVDQPLFNRYVSEKKEDMIRQRTGVITSVLAPHSTALLISETGDTITGIEGVSFQTGMFEAVAPFRQLNVLQVIRYFTEFLLSLYDLRRGDHDLPHFGEVFALFCNNDRYMRTRKDWERL